MNKHNNTPMLSWSGHLTLSEILWSVFKIALFGAVLISSALFFAAHETQSQKIREKNDEYWINNTNPDH